MLPSKRGIVLKFGVDIRIEEFSSLPSARLTVDEFRDIWFQNAADPPAFAQPRSTVPAIEDGTTEEEETALIAQASTIENEQGDSAVAEAEAQSAFLEEMVADRALEEEINRHLGNEEFQQALAEMSGITPSNSTLILELRQQHAPSSPADDGNLSELDDDDEVAGAIINEQSEFFLLRAQVWMDSNKDYLKEQRGTPVNIDWADCRKTIT